MHIKPHNGTATYLAYSYRTCVRLLGLWSLQPKMRCHRIRWQPGNKMIKAAPMWRCSGRDPRTHGCSGRGIPRLCLGNTEACHLEHFPRAMEMLREWALRWVTNSMEQALRTQHDMKLAKQKAAEVMKPTWSSISRSYGTSGNCRYGSRFRPSSRLLIISLGIDYTG